MLSDDDNLGIYDDLDEFQQAEDHKSKELLAWEVKHRNALTEIEDLKARNKALEKKIKTMEVNLQNLLDTAKSEVKRKEVLIGQLRKEKDDICFRRKRGRDVEEPAEKEPENKRLKAASSKVDPEVKKNPFKADSKIDAKSVGKRRSRSKSPKSRSKTQEHEPETRRKSRERRRSRSRSPRHLSRQEEHRSRGSSWRRRSRSPRSQVSGSKTQIIPSLLGKDTTNSREIGRKPHHEKPKRMRDEMAAPTNPIEVATTKTQGPTIEFDDISAAEAYFQGNNPKNVINGNSGAFPTKEGLIPGLDMIGEPAASNRRSAATSQSESDSKINQPNEILPPTSVASAVPKSVQKNEPQTALISNNNAQTKEHLQVDDAIAIDPSKPDIESPMRNTKYEPTGGTDDIEKPSLNQSTIELMKDHITVHAEENVDLLVASGAAQRQEADIHFSSAGSLSEPKSETCDVGIRIIEDIRLPEVSDIGHISNIVNELCGGLEGVTKKPLSDEQNNPSCKDVDYTEGNVSLSDLKEPTTPSMCSNVLYAQPDSTKFDQNDTDNGVILETALNLLPCTDLAPPPPHSATNESYPKLCLEEDAIEKALGKLHQTSSPDETVVTSTSNRARKVEHICAPTSTRLGHSSVQPEEPATLPEMVNPDDSQSQVSRLLELQPPSPSQDITIDETVDDGCIANMDPLLTVTKRCSLGDTDYQFEQRNDEIILRVKRRTRRRCSTPLEVRVPKPPSTGGTPD